MDWSFLAFVIFATIAILGSLMVILQKTPVSSAFSLVLVFFSQPFNLNFLMVNP
jgi:NADH:ubiquinone oxidoreductase subunit 6 (subunit J)